MEEKIFIAQSDCKRIDKYLSECEESLTRSRIQKLIEDEAVFINDAVCNKKSPIKKGDVIKVNIPEPVVLNAVAQDIPIDIVYEDDDVIVVNKPRGMVVHPANGNPDGTLVNALMYHCKDKLSSINGVIRPGIVHRIDKDTTGILMVAKNDEAHLFLSEQIKNHSFTREYIALADGNLKDECGIIDRPIGRSEKDRKKMAVTEKNSREAVTEYRVLERFGKYTLVRCKLYTGRTHQIRVHFSSMGHPITGDKVYGPQKQPLFSGGQLLHATKLGFVHPKTKEYVEFEKEIPKDFSEVVDKLRKVNKL